MRLGDYILRDMERILHRWESFATTRLPAAEHMSSLSLRDHGPEILRAIVADLASAQTAAEQTAKSKGLAPVAAGATDTAAQTHALLRVASGFSIEQLVSEYRALRASVVSGWAEACPAEAALFDDLLRFNEAIDQALTESIEKFSATVTQSRNLTLGNLHDANRRIEDSNAALVRQQTELELQAQDLEAALRQADDASRAKSVFLRTVSHELRTPLNAIIGFSGLLRDGSIGQPLEEQRKPLSIIQRSGQELLTLIREILDMSSIEAGKLTVALVSLDLRSVLEESRDSMLLLSAERKLELRPVVCGADLTVMADRERLGQVVRNLLSNALNHTDHGSVEVRASRADGLILVEVEDTGIGIPADQHAFLFQPFHRVTGQAGPRRPGTGLGLTISRRIVEAMGGTIGFESEEGRGSRFWFTVPEAVQP
jgi:signal transduction histidine kinase